MKSIRLDPNYPNMIRFHAKVISEGSMEPGSEKSFVATLIDMVRYQARVDESVLFPIMHELDPERAATMKEAHTGKADDTAGD